MKMSPVSVILVLYSVVFLFLSCRKEYAVYSLKNVVELRCEGGEKGLRNLADLSPHVPCSDSVADFAGFRQ